MPSRPMRISGPKAIVDMPVVPWKNGGGTTRTLAVAPDGASLDDFLWRVSLAQIDAPAAFSAFPGIDRTILLWRGEGVVLRSPSWPDLHLTEPLRPFCFRGEDAITCDLLGTSATDLNLMAKRGAVSASMRSYAVQAQLDQPCDEVLVLCAAGSVRVLPAGSTEITVRTDHFLSLGQVDARVTIVPASSGAKFVCVTVKVLR
jgi:uncharacterized protein